MDKRDGRPSLADYLRLAAMQYELDKEEDEAQNQGTQKIPYIPALEMKFCS